MRRETLNLGLPWGFLVEAFWGLLYCILIQRRPANVIHNIAECANTYNGLQSRKYTAEASLKKELPGRLVRADDNCCSKQTAHDCCQALV